MLSIGDFARYAGVSVRMLRHYDERGLIVPAHVDPVTGYRSYTAAQFPRINRLIALKDLGFTLDQVGRVLDGGLEPDELRGMLRLRREELAEQIESDRVRLASVAARLRTIESEGHMSEIEYVEKSLPAVRLAQATASVGSQPEISGVVGPLFRQVEAAFEAASAAPQGDAMAWYDSSGDGVAIGAGFPTTRDHVEGLEVDDLPSFERAVTAVHHGSMEKIGDAWQALVTEAGRRGLSPSGPGREIYLHVDHGDLDAWVTELQLPVA